MTNEMKNIHNELVTIMEKVLEEKWVDLPGWAGIYQVSNKMRVRTIGRVVKGNKFTLPEPRILKQIEDPRYLIKGIYFKLSIGGQQQPMPAIHYYRAAFENKPYNYKTYDEIFVTKKTRKSILRNRIEELQDKASKSTIDKAIEIQRKINALGHKLRFEEQGALKTYGDNYIFTASR